MMLKVGGSSIQALKGIPKDTNGNKQLNLEDVLILFMFVSFSIWTQTKSMNRNWRSKTHEVEKNESATRYNCGDN